MYIASGGSGVVSNSLFAYNNATNGGAIVVRPKSAPASFVSTDNTFIGNTATCGNDIFLQSRTGQLATYTATTQKAPICSILDVTGVRAGPLGNFPPAGCPDGTTDCDPSNNDPSVFVAVPCYSVNEPGFTTGGGSQGQVVSYSCTAAPAPSPPGVWHSW